MEKFLKIGVICTFSALSCAAQAEDSYKFSGVLDYGYYKSYSNTYQSGSMSRSSVSFAANKDLVDGISATAMINSRFFIRDASTGNYLVNEDPKYLGSGEATAGLKGDFGHVRFGRALTAMWANDWNYDAWYNFDAVASPAWWLWHGNSAADPNVSTQNLSFSRLNNGMFYSSPVFGGFSVDTSYGMKQNAADVNHSESVALKYAQKEFEGMYAREKTPAGNVDKFYAGKINLGNTSIMAAYDDEILPTGLVNRSSSISGRLTDGKMSYMLGMGRQIDYKANFYSAGASYAYKPNTSIYFSYGHKAQGFWGSAQASDAYGIGVNYRF